MKTHHKILVFSVLILALGVSSCATRGGYARGFGVRAGVVSTMGEEGSEYLDSNSAGLFFAGSISKRSMPFELAIDMTEIESDSGVSTATLYSVHLSKMIAKLKGGSYGYGISSRKQTLLPYLLIGGGGIYTENEGATTETETVGAIDVGFGIFMLKGGLDLRFLYSSIIGSNNIQALSTMTLAKKF